MINKSLRKAIFDSDLKGFEIANSAGIPNSRLSGILHGHFLPTLEQKRAIARVLKKKVKKLFKE